MTSTMPSPFASSGGGNPQNGAEAENRTPPFMENPFTQGTVLAAGSAPLHHGSRGGPEGDGQAASLAALKRRVEDLERTEDKRKRREEWEKEQKAQEKRRREEEKEWRKEWEAEKTTSERSGEEDSAKDEEDALRFNRLNFPPSPPAAYIVALPCFILTIYLLAKTAPTSSERDQRGEVLSSAQGGDAQGQKALLGSGEMCQTSPASIDGHRESPKFLEIDGTGKIQGERIPPEISVSEVEHMLKIQGQFSDNVLTGLGCEDLQRKNHMNNL